MKTVKNQIYNTVYTSSSIPKGTNAILGTVESDASGFFGRHDKEEFRGKAILDKLVTDTKFKTVLDIGSGECEQANFLKKRGKTVFTCDFGTNGGPHCNNTVHKYDYVGDFNVLDFDKKFDVTLAAHVLEHQLNVNSFLKKMSDITKDDGYIVVIVPPRKPFITGGHFSIWNAGLLLYNLIMAGVSCTEAMIKQYDYNIGIIVKNNRFDISGIDLNYDQYDIERKLKQHFPFDVQEPFNGDIMEHNW